MLILEMEHGSTSTIRFYLRKYQRFLKNQVLAIMQSGLSNYAPNNSNYQEPGEYSTTQHAMIVIHTKKLY